MKLGSAQVGPLESEDQRGLRDQARASALDLKGHSENATRPRVREAEAPKFIEDSFTFPASGA